MVDDKPKLLSAMKRVLGDRLTTVFVRQGHYADEATGQIFDPAPDLAIDDSGELATFDLQQFGPRACRQAAPDGTTESTTHRQESTCPTCNPCATSARASGWTTSPARSSTTARCSATSTSTASPG